MHLKIVRHVHGIAVSLAMFSLSFDVMGQAWPAFEWPEQAQPFAIGKEHRVNGVKMIFQGFISVQSAEQMVAEFKRKLGSEVVESRLKNKLILGQRKADFHIAVQVENLSSHELTNFNDSSLKGSKGFYSITDLKGSYRERGHYLQERSQWLNQLPAGTKVVNSIGSTDLNRVSEQWTFLNRQSAALNKKAIVDILQTKGYRLDKDTRQQPDTLPKSTGYASQPSPTGAVFLSGTDKEATVVFTQSPHQENIVVVTTIQKTRKH